MPKKQGSRNYTAAEQLRLVTEVECILPTNETEWQRVGVAFNAHATSVRFVRSLTSLRRKFNSLCRVGEQSERNPLTHLQKFALEVKLRIDGRRYRDVKLRIEGHEHSSTVRPLAPPSFRIPDSPVTGPAKNASSVRVVEASQLPERAQHDLGSAQHKFNCELHQRKLTGSFADASALPSMTRSPSATSAAYDSDRCDAPVASTDATDSRRPSGNLDLGLHLLERHLDRLHMEMVQELRGMLQQERDERRHQRNLDMSTARRYHKQLKSCLLNLKSC